MLSKQDCYKKLEDKQEIKIDDLKIIVEKNNYESDFTILIFNHNYYLISEMYKIFVVTKYEDKKVIKDFLKELHNIKFNLLPIKDYSNEKEINISFNVCDKKCINNFGNNVCRNCNYYNDCLCEIEINNFEKMQNEKLNNFYDMMENDFYR